MVANFLGSASQLEQDKLLASDGAEGDYLGDSVSISGDMAVIGASGEEDNGELGGAAYLFLVSRNFSEGFESVDTSAWSQTVP